MSKAKTQLSHSKNNGNTSQDLSFNSVHRKAKLQLLHFLQEEGLNDSWSRTMLEEYDSPTSEISLA